MLNIINQSRSCHAERSMTDHYPFWSLIFIRDTPCGCPGLLILTMMRRCLTPHQHAASLPRKLCQLFAFSNHTSIFPRSKEPLVPRCFLDKQGICHRRQHYPGGSHNFQRILYTRLQLIDSPQASVHQRLKCAYRLHLARTHLAHTAQRQFFMFRNLPFPMPRNSLPYPYHQRTHRGKRCQKDVDLLSIPAMPAKVIIILLQAQGDIQQRTHRAK